MEQHLQQLEQLSYDLVQSLETSGEEKLEQYMYERDRIFGELQTRKPTAQEVEQCSRIVRRILAMDREIMRRMGALKDEAEDQLARRSQARITKRGYGDEDDYQESSYFFDSKL